MSHDKDMDRVLLGNLLKEITVADDRYGITVVYLIPADSKRTDICKYILARNGVATNMYQSGLCEYPVLKIPFSDVNKMSNAAREFLFSLKKVSPSALNKHLQSVIAEMNQKQK